MRCFSLILGARNTSSAGKRFSRADTAVIHEITFRHFPDGFTILNADGGWFDPQQRRFIQEESRQILVCAPGMRNLRRWCRDLAHALHQQELLLIELGTAITLRVPAQTPPKTRAATRPKKHAKR